MKGSSAAVTQHNHQALRLVQITDSHLGERPGTRLLNVDTDQSLASVVSLVRAQQPRIDMLLATGDLSDQGGPKAYQRFLTATRDLGAVQRWLPGNHDNPAVMRAVLKEDARLQRSLVCGNWQVIMLDSTIPGAVGGNLRQAELAAMRACLRAEPQHYTLICVHHHVVPVGCAWIDEQMVANAEQFWRELSAFPNVRAVLSGHVHQELDRWHGDIRVFTSPSTCVQFAANSAEFRVDTQQPGYRWFDLHPDGRIDTGVERVTGVEFQVDLTASGY
jgi:3',5'-cyclic-AMP phosphodiesterase